MSDYTVGDHFDGKEPGVRQVYDCVISAVRGFGEVAESPKKTSIHLDRNTGFAGISTRKNYLLLNFRTNYQIDHPRITKIEQHSARRWMHTVRLEQVADVDGELVGWLKDAYELAG
jgi:hypothetical protein